MQDNRKQGYSPEDRGWHKMAELLDRELPGKDRRRGVIWWTMGLALVLVVAVWGYYGFTAVPQTDNPGVDEQEQGHAEEFSPVANMELSNNATLEEDDLNSSGNVTDSGAIPQSNPGRLTARQGSNGMAATVVDKSEIENTTDHTRLTTVATSDTKFNNKNIGDHRVEAKSDQPLPILTLKYPEDPGFEPGLKLPDYKPNTELQSRNLSLSGEAQSGDQTTEPLILRQDVVVASLASSDLNRIAVSDRSLGTSGIKPLTRKGGFELQVVAAVHSDFSNAPIYGAEAGLATVFRANRSLRVRSGVSYGYYNVDGVPLFGLSKSRDVESVDVGSNPGQYDPTYDPLDIMTNQIEFDQAERLTKQFHYLHMPVAVEYGFLPKWAITVGARFSYLVSAPARYSFNDPVFNNSFGGVLSSNKSFLYDYEVLKKFDVAPEIGLSFRASQRLSIDAMYYHGMIPYINNSAVPNREDYQRTLSLGLRYGIVRA